MTNTVGIGVYTPHDAREIKRRVLGDEHRKTKLFEHTDANKAGWHYGIIKEELDATCNPLTEYTQAKASVLMYADGKDNLDLVEIIPEQFQVTLTNRSPFTSYYVGELVLFRWVIKEWAVIGQSLQRIQAVLQQDMAAAVNTLNDPSTAKVKILVKKPDGDLKLLNEDITIVNRFVQISAKAGTYIKIEYMHGEWQPYNADCPGKSSFSSSSVGSEC
jgi:hypothetical protein